MHRGLMTHEPLPQRDHGYYTGTVSTAFFAGKQTLKAKLKRQVLNNSFVDEAKSSSHHECWQTRHTSTRVQHTLTTNDGVA